MAGTTNILDRSKRYTADEFNGIAVWVKRFATFMAPIDHYGDEWDEIEHDDRVMVVMVGDDREHEIEVSELVEIDADNICSCGQIGCGHGG